MFELVALIANLPSMFTHDSGSVALILEVSHALILEVSHALILIDSGSFTCSDS